MSQPWHQRIAAGTSAWLMLSVGTVLTAMAILTPAWAQSHQVSMQLETLSAHKALLDQQLERCRQFGSALDTQDPTLIQRLICHQLGLKPEGTSLLINDVFTPVDPLRVADQANPVHQAPQPIRSWLVRHTEGNTRMALVAAGLLCTLAGLMMPATSTGRTRPD